MHERSDVQNIDLMILAGFCRNCLADWYREAAERAGVAMDKESARAAIYGMPFAEWKAKFQPEASPEQLAAFNAAQTLGFFPDQSTVFRIVDIIVDGLADLIRMPSDQPGSLEVKRAILGIEARARVNGQVVHEELL